MYSLGISITLCRHPEFKRRIEISKKTVLQIFFGKDSFRWINLPVDAESFVDDENSAVSFRMVVVVALVLEDGYVAEDGEAVCKTSRDEELTVVVFCQLDSHVVAVCWRAFTDIDGYVEDCSFDAAYQFCLSERRTLEMEASHYTVGGAGLVVLDEVNFGYLLVKFPFGERFEEVASGVFEDFGLNYNNSVYICLNYFHIIGSFT